MSTDSGVRTCVHRVIPHAFTAVEVLAIYAGILLYIWRWQYSQPYAWIPLLAIVVLSHFVYHDRPAAMGLTGRDLRACARSAVPLLAIIVLGAVIYGFWASNRLLRLLQPRTSIPFLGYFVWCCFQQYLTQSYFHRRLMKIIRTPHWSSVAVALMFGGAHVPNLILMAATLIGGFIFAEIFARHPNIWPLAFVQAVAGVLIGVLSPPGLIHNMRVGPGYFFYGGH